MADITLIAPFTHTRNKINSVAIQILEKLCDDMRLKSLIIDIPNDFIDCRREMGEWIWNWIDEKLKANQSALYAITTMNASFPWALRICRMIKETNPRSKIILGGPHITALKEEIFKVTSHVDYLYLYEAETAFKALILYLRGEVGAMPGNVIAKESTSTTSIRIERTQTTIRELPIKYYRRFTDLKILDVEVGRGCPYDCYYCSSRELLGRDIRYKPISDIISESNKAFEMLEKESRLCLNYSHDNFLANKSYFLAFCAEKERQKAEFFYGCGGRIDLIDDDVLNKLISSRCKYLFIGVESGSEKIQRICRKNLGLQTIVPKVKTLVNSGIFVEANFIFGFPEETIEDLYATIRLMITIGSISSKVNVSFSYMSPEPATDIAYNTKLEDHLLVGHADYVETLRKAGFLVESEMNSVFNNHLYTIRNVNYDIIDKIHKGWDYVEFLRRYPFSSYFIVQNMPDKVTSLFESMGDRSLDKTLLKFFSAEVVETSPDICHQLIRFEILLNNKAYFDNPIYCAFQYDIQNLYRGFLLNHESFDMEVPKTTKTWIISKQ